MQPTLEPTKTDGQRQLADSPTAAIKLSTMPVLKIFPNSTEKEFPSDDELCTWLLTALKARNGEYRLNRANAIADLPSGSIVLFRFGLDKIVGEAVVIRTKRHAKTAEYPASVWFSPTSIRVFVPFIPVSTLQRLIGGPKVKDISQAANAYANFDDWSLYPKLLAAHVEAGGQFL